ncbi:MAG: hypothetical protein ACQEXJ_04710 [Myxococcota bacterium]
MAVLRINPGLALAALVGVGGCSALLDADDLRAPDASAEVSASDSTSDVPTQDADGDPDVDVVVRTPGAGSCTLVYEDRPLECPGSCPSSGGWELVFDGSDSVGVESWDWEFVASTGWTVREERDGDTPRPTVVVDLDTPDQCATGYDVKAGAVTVRLGVNGQDRQVVDVLSVAVSESTPCDEPNQCAPP